jgi:DNA replication protein DnaC
MSNVIFLTPELDEKRRILETHTAPVKRQDQEEFQAIRRDSERLRTERDAGQACIPRRFVGLSFDDYQCDGPEQERAFQTCRNFAKNIATVLEKGSNLILHGRPGTGKTHLACAIIKRLWETGYRGIYTTHEALRSHLRASYDPEATQRESAALQAFLGPDLLVIDEIEKAKGNPDTIRKDLHRLIDDRYADLKPTLVVSNMTAPALRLYLGTALWDRLTGRDHLSCLVKMDWESYRRPQ